MIDTVYLCRTMSDNEFENFYEPDRRSEADDDDSDTDSVAEWEYDIWNDACAWEFRSASGNDSLGLFQNPPTDIMQNIYRQSETDDDSDTDSAAELEYDFWNDACAWEFQRYRWGTWRVSGGGSSDCTSCRVDLYDSAVDGYLPGRAENFVCGTVSFIAGVGGCFVCAPDVSSGSCSGGVHAI